MKKSVLNFFVAITVMVLLIAFGVMTYADMGVPEIEKYEATISNVNGAKYYDSEYKEKGVIPYGTKVHVEYESRGPIVNTEERYAQVYLDDEMKTVIKDTYIHISTKDIQPIQENFDKQSVELLESVRGIVLNPKGIAIHKGPSYGYDTIATIPFNTTITYEPIEAKYSDYTWGYVKYNGVEGWVCRLYGDIGKKETGNIIMVEDVVAQNYDETQTITIPKNQMIAYEAITDPWSQRFVVQYSGKMWYIYIHDVASKENWEHEVSEENTKMYKYADTTSEVLNANIPAGTPIKETYSEEYVNMSYIEYNGQKGWIESTALTPTHLINEEEKEVIEVEPLPQQEIQNQLPIDDITEKVTDNANEKIKNLTSQQIVILCILGAMILTVTSIVIIILANKTKKTVSIEKNEENESQEPKE